MYIWFINNETLSFKTSGSRLVSQKIHRTYRRKNLPFLLEKGVTITNPRVKIQEFTSFPIFFLNHQKKKTNQLSNTQNWSTSVALSSPRRSGSVLATAVMNRRRLMRKTVLGPWRTSPRLNLEEGRVRTRVLEEGRRQGRGATARGMRPYRSISMHDAIKIEENTCPKSLSVSDCPLHSLSHRFLGHIQFSRSSLIYFFFHFLKIKISSILVI